MSSLSAAQDLQRFGKLCGLWRRNVANYGGLLHVTYNPNDGGKIIGTEWLEPKYPNLFNPMRLSPAFCIEIHPQTQQLFQHCYSSVSALQEFLTSHGTQISFVEGADGQVTEFRSKCSAPVYHQQSVQDAIQEEIGPDPDDDYRMMVQQKFSSLWACMHEYTYSRIEWPLAIHFAIVQPGLFKSDFGSDGIELVMLTYQENGTKAVATKITGDTKVPYGKVAFEANLLEAVMLNHEQQSPVELLRVVPIVHPPIQIDQLQCQPFVMPEGVTDCDFDTPNVCKARFFGLAQIAYEGFVDPVFINGHWVIFNEDLIGFLYFDLFSFTLFHRVQEKLM